VRRRPVVASPAAFSGPRGTDGSRVRQQAAIRYTRLRFIDTFNHLSTEIRQSGSEFMGQILWTQAYFYASTACLTTRDYHTFIMYIRGTEAMYIIIRNLVKQPSEMQRPLALTGIIVYTQENLHQAINTTSAATRSCRDPGTAVIRLWFPGCVRRRPQRVTSEGSGGRRDTLRPPPLLLLPGAAATVAAAGAVVYAIW